MWAAIWRSCWTVRAFCVLVGHNGLPTPHWCGTDTRWRLPGEITHSRAFLLPCVLRPLTSNCRRMDTILLWQLLIYHARGKWMGNFTWCIIKFISRNRVFCFVLFSRCDQRNAFWRLLTGARLNLWVSWWQQNNEMSRSEYATMLTTRKRKKMIRVDKSRPLSFPQWQTLQPP